MSINILPYKAKEIPVSKIFNIESTNYRYLIDYNTLKDFYTLTIFGNEGDVIFSTKLVSKNDAISCGHHLVNFESEIIPCDVYDVNKRLGADTFDELSIYEKTI